MVLLLTLMVLMILATIAVRFQADAALHLRASSNRLERQQCRYVAESGIVMGAVMVRETLRELREQLKDSQLTPEELLADMLLDPNKYSAEPNDLFEPAPSQPSFVFDQAHLELDDVVLDIEIHDENGKWPLIWIIRPPVPGGRGKQLAKNSLARFAEALQADSVDTGAVAALALKIGNPLNLPQAEVQMPPPGGKTTEKKSTVKTRSGKYRRARRSRRTSYRRQRADDKKRRALIPIFADRWVDQALHRPENADLRVPVPVLPGSFADYLGYWGTTHININSASAELLQSAFGAYGLTTEMAQAIVDHRDIALFKSTGQLKDVEGMDPDVAKDMARLAVTQGRCFSVHVTARKGRTEARLVGGVYVSKGRVRSMGAVLGG